MNKQSKKELLVQLIDHIDEGFNNKDINELCFRLGVDKDNFSEVESKKTRIIELVDYFDKRNQLRPLLKMCKTLRPDVPWPILTNPGEIEQPNEPNRNVEGESKSGGIRPPITRLDRIVMGFMIIGLLVVVFVIKGATDDDISGSSHSSPTNAQLGDRWVRPIDGMIMIYVPSGTFRMGSNPEQDSNAENDEFPQHEVILSGFWIDRTEVTNNMYDLCTKAGVCEPSPYASNNAFNGADYPVVGIDWDQANIYCDWVGGQLPTEAQWEYAARGNDGRIYPWGNVIDNTRANFCDVNCAYDWREENINDGHVDTALVGSYSPHGDSWIGVTDMAGNAWEWVSDWFNNGYYSAFAFPIEDPIGPEIGTNRVVRGGSWGDFSEYLRSANRTIVPLPSLRNDAIGVRCVLVPRN